MSKKKFREEELRTVFGCIYGNKDLQKTKAAPKIDKFHLKPEMRCANEMEF